MTSGFGEHFAGTIVVGSFGGIGGGEHRSVTMDLSQLQVSIRPHLLSTPNIQLEVALTVHNHFDHPVTVQIWDSPLDPRCAVLGVIEILDTETNTPLPIDKVLFSRMMPPPPESFVQIGSHEELSNTVSVSNNDFSDGKDYRIQASGVWKAVWDKAIESINAGCLKDLSGECSGEFVSNVAMMRFKQPEAKEVIAS